MNPKPPAAAYNVIFGYLNEIDPYYFVQPPPSEGVALEVTGCDGVTTSWLLDSLTAVALHDRISRDLAIRFIRTGLFDSSGRI